MLRYSGAEDIEMTRQIQKKTKNDNENKMEEQQKTQKEGKCKKGKKKWGNEKRAGNGFSLPKKTRIPAK